MVAITPTLRNVKADTSTRLASLQLTGTLQVDTTSVFTQAAVFTVPPVFTGGTQESVTPMAANGAVTIKTGIVQITKAGVCAMTLAAPTAAQEGTVIVFDSATAQAHTLTITAGLRGAGAGADVGTWGGAIGDGITLYAYNLFWWPVPGTALNVTFA